MEIPTNSAFEKPLIREGTYMGRFVGAKDGGEKRFPANSQVKDSRERIAKRIVLNFELQAEGKQTMLSFIGYAPATENNKLGKALRAIGYKSLFSAHGSIQDEPLIGKIASCWVETFQKDDKTRFSIISKVKTIEEEVP
jgi:hypothetical protein